MRDRGATLTMALRALDLMASGPISPGDLALDLQCSRDTVERIIRGARSAGIDVTTKKEGRRVLYSVTKPPRWLLNREEGGFRGLPDKPST